MPCSVVGHPEGWQSLDHYEQQSMVYIWTRDSVFHCALKMTIEWVLPRNSQYK
jgi:hypothetical protein